MARTFDAIVAQDNAALLDWRKGLADAETALAEAGDRLAALDTPEFRARALGLARQVAVEADKLGDLIAFLERGVAEDRAFRDVIERAEACRVAVNDILKIQVAAQHRYSPTELLIVIEALGRLTMEEAGRETGARVMERFERECLEGQLAEMGQVMRGRVIESASSRSAAMDDE